MLIGVPQETKDNEYLVALTPKDAGALVGDGQTVRVQRGAGAGSGFGDDAYAAGATLTDAAGAWDADLVVGSVLVPGAASPRVATRAMVASMRPGSVIVDVSVD